MSIGVELLLVPASPRPSLTVMLWYIVYLRSYGPCMSQALESWESATRLMTEKPSL